jgi:hypothetical protein
MKKYLIAISAALAILLAGCGEGSSQDIDNKPNNIDVQENPKVEEQLVVETPKEQKVEEEDKEPVTSSLKIEDYYPMKENTRYVYEGTGNEYASYNVMNDYLIEGKVQQRIDNGGTVMANIIEIAEGKLIRSYSRGEAYYRENILKSENKEQEILLMEPLKKGTSWELKDSRIRTITNTAVDVTTPSGNYKAMEVTTKGPDGQTVDYYVKDIGLVKTTFSSEGMEVSSSLSKIEENVPFVQTISFFYPNINDDRLYYHHKEISFHTNDITKNIVEKAYKENVPDPTSLNSVFTKNTKINSLYLNKDGNLYLDLNQAFLTEMNAGSGIEAMILQSVVNTFGHYYGVEKVYLTIENEPYSSGHITMNKGEFFQVEPIEDSIEIKK